MFAMTTIQKRQTTMFAADPCLLYEIVRALAAGVKMSRAMIQGARYVELLLDSRA